jgi:hypothetical protein
MTGPPTVLVDMSSATHGRPWEGDAQHILALNRSHSELIKFSYHDHDYPRVLEILRKLVAGAIMAIPRTLSGAQGI